MTGDRVMCAACRLWTNEPEDHSPGDPIICGLCRSGRASSYPAAVIAKMANPTWAERMAALVSFDAPRGYDR